jgi:hypothetical protein
MDSYIKKMGFVCHKCSRPIAKQVKIFIFNQVDILVASLEVKYFGQPKTHELIVFYDLPIQEIKNMLYFY